MSEPDASPSATAPPPRAARSSLLALAALVALHLAPVWALTYFPTRDGPAHLEGTLALLRFDTPEGEPLRSWLSPPRLLVPNVLDHALMAAFLTVTTPLAAEKLVITLAIAGIPLAAWRAMESLRPGSGWLALLAAPFGATWLLHMGFYNFCLGLALFFLTVASAVSSPPGSPGATLRLALWAAVLYVAHPMPLLAAAGVVVLSAAWRSGPRVAAIAGAAFVPPFVLLVAFVKTQGNPTYARFPAAQLAADLARLDVLVTFVPLETGLAIALAVVLAALVATAAVRRWRAGGVRPGDALLASSAAFAIAYFTAPVALFGGAYLTPRLLVFPCFGLLLWLATCEWSRMERQLVTVSGAAIALGLLAARVPSYRALDEDVRELATAAPWIEAGSVVLPLRFAGPDERTYPRVDALAHAASYVTAERFAVNLTFYEGTRRGQFPLDFQFEVDPYRNLGGNPESVPPCIDLAGFRKRTGRLVDFVITWRQTERGDMAPCAERTLAQIREGYDQVYTSQPRRFVKVWKRKP
jgi:hypothetical protein